MFYFIFKIYIYGFDGSIHESIGLTCLPRSVYNHNPFMSNSNPITSCQIRGFCKNFQPYLILLYISLEALELMSKSIHNSYPIATSPL
jgi:hypothetical protein